MNLKKLEKTIKDLCWYKICYARDLKEADKKKYSDLMAKEIIQLLKAEKMKKKDINNLVCPKCGKVINDKDLKHWKCSLCGASFKITLEPIKSDKKNE